MASIPGISETSQISQIGSQIPPQSIGFTTPQKSIESGQVLTTDLTADRGELTTDLTGCEWGDCAALVCSARFDSSSALGRSHAHEATMTATSNDEAMNSDVAARVQQWAAQGEIILSPPADSAVAALRRAGRGYVALMPSGETYRFDSEECECGNVMDADVHCSEVTARRRRLAASCEHQRARLKGVHVGGPCECGAVKVDVTDHTDSVGNTVMRTFSCAGCGTARTEQ